MPVPKKKLTKKQEMFCKEYLVDKNATKAAKRAGYSKKTAYSIANELLKKPEIKQFIDDKLTAKSKKLEITADYVLGNIKKIGESCIKRNKEANALKAQELLGRWLRLFEDDEGRDPLINVTVMPKIIIDGQEFKPKIGKQ